MSPWLMIHGVHPLWCYFGTTLFFFVTVFFSYHCITIDVWRSYSTSSSSSLFFSWTDSLALSILFFITLITSSISIPDMLYLIFFPGCGWKVTARTLSSKGLNMKEKLFWSHRHAKRCADIACVDHIYQVPFTKKTGSTDCIIPHHHISTMHKIRCKNLTILWFSITILWFIWFQQAFFQGIFFKRAAL